MRRLIVKRLCFLLFAAMLPLVLSTLSEAQVGRKSADMRGDLRLEVVTVPQDIAAGFERLNSQVLLYHPVNSGSDERLKTERSGNLKNYPLLIFLHGSGGSNGKIERFKWKGEVKRFAARTKGDPLVSILVWYLKVRAIGIRGPLIKCLNTSLRKIWPSIRIESTASVTAWAEKGRGNGQWPLRDGLLQLFQRVLFPISPTFEGWLICHFGRW